MSQFTGYDVTIIIQIKMVVFMSIVNVVNGNEVEHGGRFCLFKLINKPRCW